MATCLPRRYDADQKEHAQGYTIAEMLIVLAILTIVALAVVPSLEVRDTRLDTAAEEIGNALRFAVSEAARSGNYVLVDGGTRPGHILVVNSDGGAAQGAPISDPLTRRPLDIDVGASAFTPDVKVQVKFITASTAYPQLLIGSGPKFWAAQGSAIMGILQKNSGVTLTLGSRSVTVNFDEVTGRVEIP